MMRPYKILVLFYLSMILSGSLIAQKADAILSNFSGFEVDGIVYLSATIASGNTCNGIDVLKSTDNFSFVPIGNIAGICGSASHPVRYDFVDSLPNLNGVNYYQLELGGQGFTNSIEVEVRSFKNNKVQIIPNPVREQVDFHFSNPEHHTLEIHIHNSQGQLMRSFTSNLETLEFFAGSFSQGMYWIRVFNQETGSIQSGVFLKN